MEILMAAAIVLMQDKPVSIKLADAFTIQRACFLPDGSGVLVIGKTDSDERNLAHFFDLTGKKLGEMTIEDSNAREIEFSSDGKLLALVFESGLEVVDRGQKKRRFLLKRKEDGDYESCRFSPDGSRILTQAGGKATLISSTDGKAIWSTEQDIAGGCFTGDGKSIVVRGPTDENIAWYDANDGKKLRSVKLEFPKDAKRCALGSLFAVAPGDQIVYIVSQDSGALIPVDASTGKGKLEISVAPTDLEGSLGPWFTKDGKRYAGISLKSGDDGKQTYTLRQWNTETWKEEKPVDLGLNEDAVAVDYSPDGKYLLLGFGTEIRIYSLTTGR